MPHKKAYAIQIAKMCEAFINEGVDLELIVPRYANEARDIKKYYNLTTEVKVKRLLSIDLYASGKWGFFLSSISFMVSYFFYLFLKKLRGKGGIVYIIDMDTFSFLPSVFLRMPYFFETHGGKTKNFINLFFFKHISGVIVINNIIKKQIAEKLAFSKERILVWPNGIDLDLFKEISKKEARKKLSLSLDNKIIMYSGRFYGWKGLDVLVSAAGTLPDNIFIYIIGGSKEEFISLTGKNNLSSNIIFPGEKLYTEMPLWLSAADALLVLGTKYDTQSYYYTSPMKVFEYLAMNRPIIASKTPAICDIVSEKEVVFYEPDDPKDLADKILLVVGMTKDVKNKVSAARKKAESFTWKKRAKDILNFIKNIQSK